MALTFRSSLIVAAALLVTGCTTKKTEAPALSGPSELSTSLWLDEGAQPNHVVARATLTVKLR